ncbi:helix-turn-helix domain-containing protein [Halalkalibacter akibai]|nr:helix-turn-helix domain-containing protein [Halalkalibacter akibai]
MTDILDRVQLSPDLENLNPQLRDIIVISRSIEELEKMKTNMLEQMSDEQKRELFNVIQKEYNIPDYISVREASEILEVSPQMVRRYCANGKIEGKQRFENSGKWLIETVQFVGNKNWEKYIQKRARIKENSLNLAKKVHADLDV